MSCQDLETLIAEAESLETDLSSAEDTMMTRAQAQANQVAALSGQRSDLSAAISTEASDANAELTDLTSEINTFDSALESEITSNAESAGARADTNAGAISNMPIAISAVSGSVSTHEAALETGGDSLEAKIESSLSKAEMVGSLL